jgi:hypothetical protein
VNLDAIRPFISVETPGCPTLITDRAALLTIRDFLRVTRAWKTTLSAVDWEFPTLTLTVPAGAEISTTDQVYDRVRRQPLQFLTSEQLRHNSDVAWRDPGPNPAGWTLEDGVTPRVYPEPDATADATGRLDVSVVFNAANDLSTAAVPDWVWEKYEEAFIFGTLARLMRIPGKDWTNLQQSMLYAQGFEAWKIREKAAAVADFGRPTRVVSYGGY